MNDEYSAVWVSYSSISDFLKCPRLYYLKNVYRTPKERHKITLISPVLALGQIVHDVLDSISVLPQKERFKKPFIERLEELWPQISGKKGGFTDKETEYKFKKKAQEMLVKLYKNPGPLANLSIKIKDEIPHYWLSQKDGLILCGKIDWLEYIVENDTVGIIDFKTGVNEMKENSLQLPIYYLLVTHCQTRKVERISYWYIERDDKPEMQVLPNIKEAFETIYTHAKLIKACRQMNSFQCPMGKNGCRWCEPFERIIRGDGEFVGVSKRNEDIYILRLSRENSKESMIL